MRPVFRSLVVFSLALAIVAASWAGAVAQIAPLLAIPDGVPGTPGQLVTLPIIYSANGNLCSTLTYAIDFDETKLAFDPTDADQDGVPDAISPNIPPGFFASFSYDGTNTDGEIGVFITDLIPPLAGVPSRTLFSITFVVNPGLVGSARVGFSASHPTASCGTTTGQGVTVSTDDGSVALPLAVQLRDFQAEGHPDSVQIMWETVSELNNQGFNLWRNTSPVGPAEQLNATLIPSQAPGSAQGFTYTWQDTDVEAGFIYWYWLEAVDLNGTTTLYGPVSATAGTPTSVTLRELIAGNQPTYVWPGWVDTLVKALQEFLAPVFSR